MLNIPIRLAGVLLISPLAFAALAQQPTPIIAEKAATLTALAAVPSGTVRSSELETEQGQLLYSVDIAVPRKKGVEEVHVSAITGRVIVIEHAGTRGILDRATRAPGALKLSALATSQAVSLGIRNLP